MAKIDIYCIVDELNNIVNGVMKKNTIEYFLAEKTFKHINELIDEYKQIYEDYNNDNPEIITHECENEEMEVDNDDNSAQYFEFDSEEEYEPEPNSNCSVLFDGEYVNLVIEYMKIHPNHNFKTISNRFKKIDSENLYYKFKKYSKSQPIFQKINEIHQFLFEKFKNNRDLGHTTEHRDLRFWARIKAKELDLSIIKSGEKCVKTFVRKYKIKSRKITKFVNINYVNQNKYEKSKIFVEEMNKVVNNYDEKFVLNSDEIGFNYEIAPIRTLSFLGEKQTLASVQNKYSTTNSFTILPTISLSGR